MMRPPAVYIAVFWSLVGRTLLLICLHSLCYRISSAWLFSPPVSFRTQPPLLARQRRGRTTDADDDPNRWYDEVDDNATPDDVYWEEMKRQTLLANTLPATPPSATTDPAAGFTTNPPYSSTPAAGAAAAAASNGGTPKQQQFAGAATNNLWSINNNAQQQQQENSDEKPSPKAVEATLSQYYDTFRVADNWLDEDLAEIMLATDDDIANTDVPSLDEQLDAWEAEDDDDEDDENDEMDQYQEDDPWDTWGKTEDETADSSFNPSLETDIASNEYLLDPNAADTDDDERQHRLFLERLEQLRISSPKLERARNNPLAKAYFMEKQPNPMDYCDRMWVAAIDPACLGNLAGVFRNYGIELADNFGDWKDGCLDDCLATIEDIAAFKARQVHAVTGLPAIGIRTSFEIEPVPDLRDPSAATSPGMGGTANTATTPRSAAALMTTNPMVMSGYRFNDVGDHVDYIADALREYSEPDRLTRFRTCLCYYDGDMELFNYGVCDVDLVFCNSLRTFIPVSQAINNMAKTLEMTFDLTYQKWLRTSEVEELVQGARIQLRDRVLKEGRVLPNDIVDVSAFMDSMVDVQLMDSCARDLAHQVANERPTKILTVATTGLVLALPMAKYLQVPCVYARKERNVVMADTYIAAYSSKTVGKNRELIVSKSHVTEEDRILIVDDFLSGGSSQEALLRIVADAGATPVGVAVLLEKVYESGRQALSGFNIPVFSLCRIASVQSGVIQLMEEKGYAEDMERKSQGESKKA